MFAEFQRLRWHSHRSHLKMSIGTPLPNSRASTRGGALPYWRWRGHAAGQGMILRSSPLTQGIYIGLIGYWRTTPFITWLLPSPQCLWQARDFGTSDGACGTPIDFYECMMIHSRIESPSVPVQDMHMKVFSIKGILWQGVFLVLRAVLRQGFHPPPPSGTGRPVDRWIPPPPPQASTPPKLRFRARLNSNK